MGRAVGAARVMRKFMPAAVVAFPASRALRPPPDPRVVIRCVLGAAPLYDARESSR